MSFLDGGSRFLAAVPAPAPGSKHHPHRSDALAEPWNLACAVRSLCDYVHSLRELGVDDHSMHQKSVMSTVNRLLKARQDQAPGFIRPFFDDQAWFVQSLLDAYEAGGKRSHLAAARRLFHDTITRGWDERSQTMWWDAAHTQRATAANAGVISCALRLYQLRNVKSNDKRADALLHEHTFPGPDDPTTLLSFATGLYKRWNKLTLPFGRVIDHIRPPARKGGKERTYYWPSLSYNQGVMLFSALSLHRLTGVESYAADADALASFLSTHLTRDGGVLADCAGDRPGVCEKDCSQFKGPAYRALRQYYDERVSLAMQLAGGVSTNPAALREKQQSIWRAEQQSIWKSLLEEDGHSLLETAAQAQYPPAPSYEAGVDEFGDPEFDLGGSGPAAALESVQVDPLTATLTHACMARHVLSASATAAWSNAMRKYGGSSKRHGRSKKRATSKPLTALASCQWHKSWAHNQTVSLIGSQNSAETALSLYASMSDILLE